ncbi:radical SAM protein [Halorubrum sp. AD140]|uniref:radical SAM protein n=1 Tax=Halorubrum sp. AD140 TaxID=3050073 RepID=UPI002ACCC2C2|nr:radical SAM protein [Halorubrum sp. AD140]MDZ5811712.1 radical SAM protein [Halorubrum sp. AD140]
MFDDIDVDRRPLVLIWEVTQACGLACRHCRADAKPRRHPDELTTEEGRRLLDDAAEFGDGQLVVLSGGDPLAREDLTELVSYGTELGHRMTITPSGTASLTPDRVSALADAGIERMALSLDGATRESHNRFRGEESFADTMTAARAARDVGLPLQVNTTVCAETVEELPAIRDRVHDLGAVLWSVFFLVPVGRGRILEPISPGHAEEVMSWLHGVAEAERFGVKTTEAPFYRRVGLQRDGDESAVRRRGGITAGRGFAFVSHTGETYPSGFLPKSAGNVRDRSVVDIYRNAELFESLREPDRLAGKCGACEFRQVCGGSRSRAFAATGDPLESDPLCPYVPDGYDGELPQTLADGNSGVRDAAD